MSPADISLQFGLLVEPHHGSLAVLEVALQVVVHALHDAHPEIARDDPAPYDPHAGLDQQLAAAVVTSALSLLDLLRCYRAARDDDIPF
jgi:hypothetical protein